MYRKIIWSKIIFIHKFMVLIDLLFEFQIFFKKLIEILINLIYYQVLFSLKIIYLEKI